MSAGGESRHELWELASFASASGFANGTIGRTIWSGS